MMREVVHIRRFEKRGPLRLWLQFTDGLAGEWQFSPMVNDGRAMTAELRDPAAFDRVFLDFGALTWPNGYDVSPEALHADMQAAGALSFEAAA